MMFPWEMLVGKPPTTLIAFQKFSTDYVLNYVMSWFLSPFYINLHFILQLVLGRNFPKNNYYFIKRNSFFYNHIDP